MKKIVASVGLVALGASSINAVHGQQMTAQPYKPWNISASLRGFYDDNVTTAPDGAPKTSTYGFQVSPSVGLNWSQEQTVATLNYEYSLLYYGKRPISYTKDYDQDHTFNGKLTHAFNERYQVSVTDSFVVGQEPDALRYGVINANQHIAGNNIRNYGGIRFNAQITPLLSADVGYNNAFYDYADSFSPNRNINGVYPFAVVPSNSGLLDRIENSVYIDGLWTVQPETQAGIGYQYQQTDFTANEPIAGYALFGLNPPYYLQQTSKSRNSRSHIVYLRVDHTFLPDLAGHLKVGGQYIDFYNRASDQTKFNPYVVATLQYTYAPQSHAELGFTQTRAPLSFVGPSSTNYVNDADVSLVYGSITHRIVPNLFGSIIGTFQYNTFSGKGSYDGKTEQYYQIGLNLKYKFNPHVSAEVGYNYDKTKSDLAFRTYDRNRVYFGVAASY